jgi:hypothetical protein
MAQDSIFAMEKQNIPSMPIKNWIMLLLASKRNIIAHDVHSIMMEAFILSKEVLPNLETEFEFKRTPYGPFSDKVASTIPQLLSTKMIQVKSANKDIYGGFGFILTDAGAQKAEKLIHRLPGDLKERMHLLKSATRLMGLTGMVQFIYSNYPEYVFMPEGEDRNV